MKAKVRESIISYGNDFLLDLEAETELEKKFLEQVKKQGLISVGLQRKDAETLILPSHANKTQFNISNEALSEIKNIFKKIGETL